MGSYKKFDIPKVGFWRKKWKGRADPHMYGGDPTPVASSADLAIKATDNSSWSSVRWGHVGGGPPRYQTQLLPLANNNKLSSHDRLEIFDFQGARD